MDEQIPVRLRHSGANDESCSLYRQSIVGCLASSCGSHGLEHSDIDARLARLRQPVQALREAARTGSLEHFAILDREDDIVAAEVALAALSEGARTILFLGTGGSGLGGQTLAQINGWHIPGSFDARQKLRPRTRFLDNLDAATLAGTLASLDLTTTRFVVISKSGGTAETLVQMIAAIDAMRSAGLAERIGRSFLAVSDPQVFGGRNALRQLCQRFSIPVLDHPTGIGGRYSCFSIVGLLPALARGLDARAVRRGAKTAVRVLFAEHAQPDELKYFAPAIGAAVAIAFSESRGVRTNVMMPYSDRLQRFGHWYAQLWAESLGKGGKGTTPMACLGPVDQHSQLQLFMDGPRDHFITLLEVGSQDQGPILAADLAAWVGLQELAGRTAGDLVSAQSAAVAEALAQAGRPVRVMGVGRIDEKSLGALLMHFIVETILAAHLLGVDPFDQPGVELAKRLTRERLGIQL